MFFCCAGLFKMWFTHIGGQGRCQGKIVNLKEKFFCVRAVANKKITKNRLIFL